MDGGSGLNILYVDTLDAMRIPWLELRPMSSPFHGVILGVQAYPLGQIDLPVMFGDRANFYSEVLTFEVVDFLGSFHAILGRPCYAKFMAVPNYTYLKAKAVLPSDLNHGTPRVKAFNHDRAMEAQQDIVDLLEEARKTTIIHSARY
ncbi:uncharacterized protein [Miscanthus floridulus]|uniref:uncharacterized protein n=1 Tax=Miscanthus floridulus TaxID=154761 RepID=UPI00345780B7